MTLNCKQGDLAIVVKSLAGNEGKIVKCLASAMVDRVPTIEGETIWFFDGFRQVWLIETPINVRRLSDGRILHSYFISDKGLRPLRGDLSDESAEKEKALTL